MEIISERIIFIRTAKTTRTLSTKRTRNTIVDYLQERLSIEIWSIMEVDRVVDRFDRNLHG